MKVGGASFSFPRSMFKLPWGERGLEWIYTPIMHALHTYTTRQPFLVTNFTFANT